MRGLGASVTGNAQAFGYSITITVTFGVLAQARRSPSMPDLITFALAAVAAFTVLNLIVSQLGQTPPGGQRHDRAVLVGTATDFLAVGGAVGVAMVLRSTWGSWATAPFVASVVYVLVQSIELAVGQRRVDDEEPSDD